MFKSTLLIASLMAGLATQSSAEALAGFDVAEDHTRFAFADTPVHESGMPAHGNPFVTQGYIYPAGTLAGNKTGVLEDGSPAFPDKVLGTWTCDGWFVGEGGDATSGVWLISRQVMQFNSGEVVITQGTEIADMNVPNLRPITGATGDYAQIEGPMSQTLLGFTEFMGVNVSFEMPAGEDSAFLYRDDQLEGITYGQEAADSHLNWDSGFAVGPVDNS